MRKAIITFTALLFITWLMPLGIFIKSSQEKMACDGQRAICMCHVAPAQAQHKAIDGIALSGNAGQKDEAASSFGGGSSHYLSTAQWQDRQDVILARLFVNQSLVYQNPSLSSLDHVPKI